MTRTSIRAFGIEPHYEPYSLRQARYFELGIDVARYAGHHFARTGRPVELLDVGVFDGVARRYIEAHPGGEHVVYHAVDNYPHGESFVYKHADWTHHHLDLEEGLGPLPAERYDVVICEQVLEHLLGFGRLSPTCSASRGPAGCWCSACRSSHMAST